MLFFVTFVGMLYLATGQLGYPSAGVLLLVLLGVIGYLNSDLVRLRVDSWLNPWPEASGRAFQVVQSLQAYGAGGILGEGLGLGSPSLIPAVHTDFVHAAAAEELGLVGSVGIVCLYGVLMARGFRAASRARSAFSQLLAGGITMGLTIQAWVIMAGNAKLAPITGVTLPFVSYGGSSLLASCATLGLLLRISAPRAWSEHRIAPALAPSDREAMHSQLQRVSGVLTLALFVLALTCGYWGVVRSSYLENRADNVRRLLSAQRAMRGAILDRDGRVIADSSVGPDQLVTRRYLVPEAAPAVGYASLRFGSGGIERAVDDTLTGRAQRTAWEAWWDDQLHRPLRGSNVQLTLDADLQRTAQRRLEDVQGAAVLLDAETGEVLVLASSPTFDPNVLDDEWGDLASDPASPLLNRATQGLVQPGTVLHTVLLAEALAAEPALMDAAPEGVDRVVTVDGAKIACSPADSDPATLAEAYARGCPGPIVALAENLGPAGLSNAFERWELDKAPRLEIPSDAVAWDAALNQNGTLISEALGQGTLLLSPFRVALIAATLAADGRAPVSHLLMRVQDADAAWQEVAPGEQGTQTAPKVVAEHILGAWASDDQGRIRSLAGTAVAGQAQPPHAWYMGVTTVAAKTYAVAVLVEHGGATTLASSIGLELLRAALAR